MERVGRISQETFSRLHSGTPPRRPRPAFERSPYGSRLRRRSPESGRGEASAPGVPRPPRRNRRTVAPAGATSVAPGPPAAAPRARDLRHAALLGPQDRGGAGILEARDAGDRVPSRSRAWIVTKEAPSRVTSAVPAASSCRSRRLAPDALSL